MGKKIKTFTDNIYLALVYRKSDSNHCINFIKEFYSKIEERILLYNQKAEKVIVIGDFNAKIGNIIMW